MQKHPEQDIVATVKLFTVTITETLKLTVLAEAENQEEAEQIVSDHWNKSEYILGAENFVDVQFDAIPVDQNICIKHVNSEELVTVEDYIDKCQCHIHSLEGGLAEATIIKKIGDNLYLADYNGVKCSAIFNCFVGRYYVDDVYGLTIPAEGWAQ